MKPPKKLPLQGFLIISLHASLHLSYYLRQEERLWLGCDCEVVEKVTDAFSFELDCNIYSWQTILISLEGICTSLQESFDNFVSSCSRCQPQGCTVIVVALFQKLQSSVLLYQNVQHLIASTKCSYCQWRCSSDRVCHIQHCSML